MSSTYKSDHNGNICRPYQHHLVERPKTSFDTDTMITSYRYAFGKENPNREEILQAADYGIPPGLNVKPKSRSTNGRETVGSCLTWHCPRAPSEPGPARTSSRRASINEARRFAPKATEVCAANDPAMPNDSTTANDFSSVNAEASNTGVYNGAESLQPSASENGGSMSAANNCTSSYNSENNANAVSE